MAFLKVFTNGTERTIFLGDDPVVFGREESCDVLVKDIKASRVHCVVELAENGGWCVRDLDSGNGTKLNGHKIHKQVLHPEDVIQIGDCKILFAGEAAAVVMAEPVAEERPGARRQRPAKKSNRTVAILAVVGLVAAAGILFFAFEGLSGGDTGPDVVETAWFKAVVDTTGDKERVRLAKTFLGRYPDSLHAREVKKAMAESRRRLADGTAGRSDGWDPTEGISDLAVREIVARLSQMLTEVPVERRPAVRTALSEYRDKLRTERDEFFDGLERDVKTLVERNEYARAREMWFFLRGDPNWEPIPNEYLRRIVSANEGIENAAAAERGRLLEEEAKAEATHQFDLARKLLVGALPRFKGTSVERSLRERLESVDRALKLGVSGQPSGEHPVSLVRVDVEKKMKGIMAQLELRRWAMVATGLRTLADRAKAHKDPGFGEIHFRAREAEAAAALHSAMTAALAGGVLPKRPVAKKWRVLSGDSKGVKVSRRGAEHDYPWAEAPPALYLGLLEPWTEKSKRGDLGFAVIAEAVGTNADVVAALEKGYADEKNRKLLDTFVAARLRRETLPDGGYTVHNGEIYSRKEYLRKEEEKLIVQLQAQLDRAYAAIKGDSAFKRLGKLERKKNELDKARDFALELIFDEKKYFYPYRGTGRMGEYTKVQQEVDRRVKAVEDIWEGTLTASVKKSPELERALKQFDEAADQLERKLVDVEEKVYEIAFLRSYIGRKFNIRSLFRDRDEWDLLEYSDEVMAFNTAVEGDISDNERAQVEVTNGYRMMFGRWPVRLVEKLVLSSRGHCKEMMKLGYFGHFSPTPGRRTPYDRMRIEGYVYGASENIIAGQTTPEGAHNGWCHSSGHHRNILMPPWTEMGTGHFGRMMCQNFGQAPKWSKDDPKPEDEDAPTGYEWEDEDLDGCGGGDEGEMDYEDEDE